MLNYIINESEFIYNGKTYIAEEISDKQLNNSKHCCKGCIFEEWRSGEMGKWGIWEEGYYQCAAPVKEIPDVRNCRKRLRKDKRNIVWKIITFNKNEK